MIHVSKKKITKRSNPFLIHIKYLFS